jgi:hypothetical protein
MTTEIFLKSDDSCPLRNICGLQCLSTLLDPTVSILSEVFLGLDDSYLLRPSGNLTCSQPFSIRYRRLILNFRSNIDLTAGISSEAPASDLSIEI